jgi:hypothetical protein
MSDPLCDRPVMTTRTPSRNEPQQINEIDGYMELGMREEALRQVHLTLNRSLLTPEQFNTSVFALLQTDRPESWRRTVEHAYGRLKQPQDDRVRSAMINFYFTIGEAKLAWRYFPRRWTKFFDAWVMMQVCLELGRLNQAKVTAQLCSEILAGAEDDFTRASMIDALASYHVELGNRDTALALWEESPNEPCFQRQRLCGIVKIHLARALEAAKSGLAKVAAARINFDLSTEVQLPGNTAAMLSDSEGELTRLERDIEKLIPTMRD